MKNILNQSKKSFANYLKKPKNPDRIYKYRRFDMEYEKEKAEYQQKYKETIKDLKKQYWIDQTKAENDYIEFYRFQMGEKKYVDECKDRKWMVVESWKCLLQMRKMMENQQKFIAKQKIWHLEDKKDFEEKQSLLTLLDKQAENWLTPNNFHQKISGLLDTIVPPTIVSHKDYYKKLNRYANLLDEGKVEEAEEFKRKDLNQDFKNQLLVPIYQNLKKMIMSVSKTPEHEIFLQYYKIKQRIENNYDVSNGVGKEILTNIQSKFKEMVAKQRQINEKPDIKLQIIEKQLQAIISLLITWNRYIEIIYISDDDLHKEFKFPETEEDDISNKPYHFTLLDEEDDVKNDETFSSKNIFLHNIEDSQSKYI